MKPRKLEMDIEAPGGLDAVPADPQPQPSPGGDPPGVLRYQGVTVACKSLTYTIRSKKGRRKFISLLHDVSFYLQPGSMTAILGPSGCGKTSCLNCIAGRVSKSTISSESKILYDGHAATGSYLRHNVGYVEQEDSLLGFMTPYEMLLYTAELKHPRHQPAAEKRAQVGALIDTLALRDCKDTVIGSMARRGISGGEAKRTNIGIALITNPAVLYIDEMTSGLDSFTGHEVALAVKALALGGMTVAASLHSPPSHTFDLFDRILLLQRGRVVYFGDNGAAVMDYFLANFPSLRTIRPSEGIADWLLDVTTRANYDVKQAAVFADVYAASDLYGTNWGIVESLSVHKAQPHQAENGSVDTSNDSGSHERVSVVNPMWWALFIMFRYRSLKSYRQASFISPRLFDKVMIVFLVVTLWWRIGNNPQNANATAAILFLWSMLTAFTSMGILPSIVLERPVTNREIYDGLFAEKTFVIYKLVEELLPQLLTGLAYSALVFYLVDLQGSFLFFWLVYLVSTANAIACTFLVSAMSPNTSVAGALMSSYATTLFFFSGFLIPFNKIPVYWRWYSTIDHLRYAFGAMMANQFSGNDPVLFEGQTILQYYDLETVYNWAWLGYESLFFPVFALLLWAAVTFLRYTRQ